MAETGLLQVDYVDTGRGEYEPVDGILPSDSGPDGVAYEDLLSRIHEGNQRYMVVPDGRGCPHEFTVFNRGQPKRALLPSTSYSSLLKNPANFLEAALLATIDSETEFVYWGSFGNLPTGHLSKEDRQYQRVTGRYTKGNGTAEDPYRAIDGIKYLVELLIRLDLVPDDQEAGRGTLGIAANEEAGRLALGIMAGLPEDSTKGVYLNAIDGLSPHAHYLKDDFVSDMKSRVTRRRMGDGAPGDLTPVNIKTVKDEAPRIYHGLNRYRHLPPFVWLPSDLRDKYSFERGRGKHNDLDELEDHAVYQDMSAALRRHNTIITVRLNEAGGQDIAECRRFGSQVMKHIPTERRGPDRGVRFLIGQASSTENADEPHKSARAVRRALSSPEERRRQMAALPSGGLSISRVFALESLGRAA